MEVASYRTGGLIALKTFSDVASRLSSFLLLLLAARFLDPFEFGLFSLAWATGWIISIASDLGLQLFVAREVARSPGQAGQFVPTLFRLRLYLGSILFGVIGLAHWVLWWDKGGPIFLGLVLVQLLSSVIEFFNHLFRGFGRSDLESWANLLHRLGALLAGGFVLATSSSLSFLTLALLSIAAFITLLTWSWAVTLVGQSKKSDKELQAEPERNKGSLSRRFLTEILPIGLGILASGVYFRLDLLFLEWFRDTSVVGQYTAVFRLVDAARVFPAAVIAVLFPRLCRSRSKSLATRTVRPLGGEPVRAFGKSSGWALGRRAVVRLRGSRVPRLPRAWRTAALADSDALRRRLRASRHRQSRSWLARGPTSPSTAAGPGRRSAGHRHRLHMPTAVQWPASKR